VKQQKSERNIVKPKMGRPVKRPDQNKLTWLGHVSFALDDVRSILQKSRERWPTMDDRFNSRKITVVKGKDGKPVVQSH
jgi:hypothetical protein